MGLFLLSLLQPIFPSFSLGFLHSLTGEVILIIFFHGAIKPRGGGLDHTLACEIQIQEISNFPSQCTGNIFIYTHNIMGDKKCLLVHTNITGTQILSTIS